MSIFPPRIFKIKPASGVLPNSEFQLVVIKMTPREAKVYDHLVKFQLNSTGAVNSKVSRVCNTGAIEIVQICVQSFSLHGSGEIPKTILENKVRFMIGVIKIKIAC